MKTARRFYFVEDVTCFRIRATMGPRHDIDEQYQVAMFFFGPDLNLGKQARRDAVVCLRMLRKAESVRKTNHARDTVRQGRRS